MYIYYGIGRLLFSTKTKFAIRLIAAFIVVGGDTSQSPGSSEVNTFALFAVIDAAFARINAPLA
jgi:hypothetical protein